MEDRRRKPVYRYKGLPAGESPDIRKRLVIPAICVFLAFSLGWKASSVISDARIEGMEIGRAELETSLQIRSDGLSKKTEEVAELGSRIEELESQVTSLTVENDILHTHNQSLTILLKEK